jgi:hypothetical protein
MEGINDICECPSGKRGKFSNVESIATLIINENL